MRPLRLLALLFCALATVTPSAQTATPDGRAVLQKMHDAYAGKWFKTLTFVQKTTIVRDTGTVEQTWYESYQVPGKLRIDTAPIADGNGTLQLPDKVIVVRGGKVTTTRPGGNPFLPFVGDLYAQPVDATIAQLAAEKYDLSKTHTIDVGGRQTVVVGTASKDDLTSPQFWVDDGRLVVVRAIIPSGGAAPPLDITLDNYVQSGGGWVATKVSMSSGGKLRQLEEYTEVKTNVALDAALFDTAQWSTAPHWARTPTRPAARTPATLLIRDVTVIDGTGAPSRPHTDVYVRDGRIAGFAQPAGETPTTVIEGAGKFLMPGLIDAHVHLSGAPWTEANATLKRALQGGITTVFDVAGDARFTSDLARAQLSGEIPAPTIYYSALFGGPAFMKDPRVAASSVGFTPGQAPWAFQIDASTDLVQAIAAAKGTGAHAIKLYAALDADTVRRIGAEASRQQVRLIAHGNVFPAKASELIAAGVKYLAHAPYLVWNALPTSTDFTKRAQGDFAAVPADGPAMTALLQSMKAHDVALNPTLWVLAEGGGPADPSGRRTAWANAFTRQAQSLGVTIAAGVDSLFTGTDPLPLIHRELELLVGAGLTPMQALVAGTQGAAHGIGVDDRRGSIAIGQAADLLLLDADPTANIRNTRSIRTVIQAGKVVAR